MDTAPFPGAETDLQSTQGAVMSFSSCALAVLGLSILS